MTEIIIIRHGETEWNVANIFRGRLDVPLNENGISQAESLSRYLGDWKIDAIYSSPLKRAFQTAELVAHPHGLAVEVAKGLIDFNFGEWQGLSHREAREKFPDVYKDYLERPEKVQIPGGESLEEVRTRALSALEVILSKGYGSIALVSHRVVNKVLICALLGLDNSHFWNIEQDNCGLSVFKYDGNRYVLSRHNETCFIEVGKVLKADF